MILRSVPVEIVISLLADMITLTWVTGKLYKQSFLSVCRQSEGQDNKDEWNVACDNSSPKKQLANKSLLVFFTAEH